MKIIISPAKRMKRQEDLLPVSSMPAFLDRAELLLNYMKSQDRETLQKIWRCSDAIADLNIRRLKTMDLTGGLTPAVLCYEGLQYRYMAPAVFEDGEWEYVKEHLFILSGFYGALRAGDGIVPYRLEMQAKISPEADGIRRKDLYDFWGRRIFDRITEEDRVIINLASEEYSRAAAPWVTKEILFLTCRFQTWKEAGTGERKPVTRATEAKMARGEMVRYLAEIRAGHPEELKGFDRLGYRFCPERSQETEYVFLKEEPACKGAGRSEW